ncbi:MAG: alpha/beta fold hydrolase [Myxococcota bacterium]
MAHVDRVEWRAADGAVVAARWYTPPGSARSVVLVGGATGVPQGYYRGWAGDLADRGHEVVTFDYRGVGESRVGSLRGYSASMTDWGHDWQTALDAALARAGERPTLLVGHSFGGQALGLVDRAERLAGGITVGAQLGYWGHWPAATRWAYAGLWYAVMPAVASTLGYVPGQLGVGEDLPAGVAREWAKWCRSPNYLLDHVPQARDRFASVMAPFRVVGVTDDSYAPDPAVRAFAALLPRAELRTWSPADAGMDALGHFGFFRRGARRLWDEVAGWLEQRADEAARRTA